VAERTKKTFRMPSKSAEIVPQKPPPPAWVSGGATADVYYDTQGAFYEMRGMDALQQNIALLPEACQDAAGCEMANIAAEVIQDAKDNYVPVKFGNLKDSGRSDEYEPGRGMGITEIGMWFGGPPDVGSGGAGVSTAAATQAGLSATADPALYALVQHEFLGYHHTIGGAKYLEKPLLAMLPKILPRIARAIAEIQGVTPRSALFALGGGPQRGASGQFEKGSGLGSLGEMGGSESSL
jgi:hypothetical protein